MIKDILYDYLVFPLYKLNYLMYYGVADFFNAVAIETTTYCNLRCKWCPNSKYSRGLLENKKLMEEKLFKKIINELSEIDYNGHILLHFYGEPLTDDRLPNFISYIKDKVPRSKVSFSTNGILLTLEKYKELIRCGLDNILINQYTKEMLSNIKEVLEYCSEGISYRTSDEIKFSNLGGEIKEGEILKRPECAYPNYVVNINYKGDVVLCCADYHGKYVFGNLNNEKLVDIWNKSNYKQTRKELRKGIYKLPICRRCMAKETE